MPQENKARQEWINNRGTLLTTKNSEEIARDIPADIRARAFFSSRVSEAHIADRFRSIEDDYLNGKISRDEARNLMMGYAIDSGKDDGTKGLRNLASTARLNLIIDQNAKMAKAVGDYERMYDPANMEAFPYVIYHASVGSKNPRSEHKKYDGMIFDKNDPWLRSHWPPSEFGCNCELENCSAKKAGKDSKMIQKISPPEVADKVDSRSKFVFNPENGIENDASKMDLHNKQKILNKAEVAVKDGKLGDIGIVVQGPRPDLRPREVPNVDEVRESLSQVSKASFEFTQKTGIKPEDVHNEDYKAVNKTLLNYAKKELKKTNEEAKKYVRTIPEEVLNLVPDKKIELGTLNPEFSASANLPEDLPISLERGDGSFGLSHLWIDHKDLFFNPDKASLILQETIGSPECRMVVSLKHGKTVSHGYEISTFIKRIVLHNPKTKSYCVLRVSADGKRLEIVSFNRAEESYGNGQWALK